MRAVCYNLVSLLPRPGQNLPADQSSVWRPLQSASLQGAERNTFLVVQQDFATLPTSAQLFPLVLSHTFFHSNLLRKNLNTGYKSPLMNSHISSVLSTASFFSFHECEAVISLTSGPKHPSYKI